MDTIKVKCKCGATLQVSPDMAGKLGTCSKCGKTMRIPHDLHAKTAEAPKKITLQPETGPVSELYLPWDIVAPATPPDQFARESVSQ